MATWRSSLRTIASLLLATVLMATTFATSTAEPDTSKLMHDLEAIEDSLAGVDPSTKQEVEAATYKLLVDSMRAIDGPNGASRSGQATDCADRSQAVDCAKLSGKCGEMLYDHSIGNYWCPVTCKMGCAAQSADCSDRSGAVNCAQLAGKCGEMLSDHSIGEYWCPVTCKMGCAYTGAPQACGGHASNARCPAGECCSFGFCGSTYNHCNFGCEPEFGRCDNGNNNGNGNGSNGGGDGGSMKKIGAFQQCGGKGGDCQRVAGGCADAAFPGYTCEEGYICQKSNEWYYQCVPR